MGLIEHRNSLEELAAGVAGDGPIVEAHHIGRAPWGRVRTLGWREAAGRRGKGEKEKV